MAIEIHKIEDREQWIGLRKQDVTASVAGALFGIHDYTTAFSLWATKSGRISDVIEDNPALKRGRLLEPVAKQLIAEEHPDWVMSDPGVYLRDPEARLGCTPDLFVDHPTLGAGVIQIKSTADIIFKKKWRDPSTFEINVPLWIALQALVECDLAQRKWAKVALLVVGMGLDLYLIDIPLSAALMARVREETAKFWEVVDSGEEMAPDYAQDAATIAKVYSEGDQPPLNLDADNRMRDLISRMESLKLDKKAAETDLETVGAEIKHKLGNHEAAFCGGRVVSWKLQHRKEFTTKANSFRVLRIS